jgi:iron complex outermembrane receptor protein
MKHIILPAKIFWIIIFCFAAAFPAAAKEEAANYRDAIPIMEEVIVTATKIPEKRKDIPNATVTMDAKDIAASGAASLEDLLANEPGLDGRNSDYPGAGREIHIRGFRGNGTQVLLNGIPVNSPSLGLADLGKIPFDSMERVEVVKGSGSLLYGSGAMGGVINITTKSPQKEKPELKIRSGYGSHNTYRLGIAQGMYFTDTWGYYLTANRAETAGDRPNSFLRQNDVSLKMTMNGDNDSLKINLYGNYLSREYGLPGVRPPAGTSAFQLGGETFYNSKSASLLDRGKDHDALFSLELTDTPLSWLEYTLRGYYRHMENDTYARLPAEGAETKVTNKSSGISGHVNLTPFSQVNLLLGGEYRGDRWENKSALLDSAGSPQTGGQTKYKARVNTNGFFSEFHYRPSPYGKILAGIRHERHSEFGSANLPFFGVILNPFTNTALKFNHGKHFLAPTPNALFWPDDGLMKGNPALKPEIGWHTDITLEQSLFHDQIFFSLSYFRWRVDDKIEWGLDSQWVYSPRNLLGYRAQGFEAGIKAVLSPHIRLGLSYTHLDAEEETMEHTIVKRRATYTPREQFKGHITYDTESGFTVSATVRYTGNRLFYDQWSHRTYTLAPYWTGDLQVAQRFLKRYILFLSVNNIADKRYDTRLGGFNGQLYGYPGAGRFIFLGLSYDF